MDKKEYIKRQISRTNKKDYENYVATRIIHKLDDLDIKFVIQQYVKRSDGGRALADMYFPQINYFIEIDEGHHLNQKEADKVRDADFISTTGRKPKRIEVSNSSIEKINDQVENVISEMKKEIKKLKDSGEFIPWDIDKEMNPDIWIKKGKIRVKDKVAFRTHADALRCMGLNYKRYQRGGRKHPYEENTLIWFPKLYPNGVWDNDFNEDKGEIIEKNIESKEKRIVHIEKHLNDPCKRRIVFAHVKGVLGDTLYRFRGIFELDEKNSNTDKGLVWKRTSKEAKTYDYS